MIFRCVFHGGAALVACALASSQQYRYSEIGLSEAELPRLEAAVTRARGIYRAARPDAVGAADTVLVTSFNAAYFTFFANWACHVERLGLRYLAWPQDARAAGLVERFLEPDGHGRFGTLFFSEGVTGTLDVPTAEATFRQPAFNQMSVFKLVIVHVLLQSARVNVWFSDVDIVFVADPWPAFRHRQACDYEFQPNSRDYDGAGEGNTGFHKFKSSAPTLDALKLVLADASRRPDIDDQTIFWSRWNALPNRVVVPLDASDVVEAERAPSLRICPLPIRRFPSGDLLRSGNLSDAVIVHANFRKGETRKRKILTTLGLWMLTEETRCQVGWPSGALSLTRRRPTRRHAEEKPGPRRHLVIAIMAAGALPLLAIARCRRRPEHPAAAPALEPQEPAV